MKQLHNIVAPLVLFCLMMVACLPVLAQEQAGEVPSQTQDAITPQEEEENTVDVKEIVFGHIGDSYEWHITTWGKTHITIPSFIVVIQVGMCSFLHVSKRMAARMKGSPSLPKEVSMKANWLNIMRQASKFALGIFLLRK